MARNAYDSMPPQPECEFDFNLPHGADTEEEQFEYNSRQPVHQAMDLADIESCDDPREDVSRSDKELNSIFADDEDGSELPLNYDRFPNGFSDDEGGKDAFDRSWETLQTKKLSSKKSKKSPRRSDISNNDDQPSPKTKRPRKSLFGGAGQEAEEQDQEDGDEIKDRNVEFLDTTQPDIQNRLSSLGLDQQEAQDVRVPILGRGLGYPDIGSPSPAPSRSPSEESVVILSDDRV
jgi:hypothetical protein